MKTLAIDYGEKYFGLAICDDNARFARPLNTIITRKQSAAIKQIITQVNENQVKRILIGLPLGRDNKPTQKSQEVHEFITLLSEHTDIPIITWNEVLTSKQADQNITNKKHIHSEAARIMLQEFIDHEQITTTT